MPRATCVFGAEQMCRLKCDLQQDRIVVESAMTTYGYYTLIESDAQLRAVADELKAFARANPLDPDSAKDSIDSEPGQKERIGPMMRIHGKEAGEYTKKYSRFITLSAKDVQPLQISYVEYGIKGEESVVRQLTVVHNNKEALRPQDITRIGYFFLNMKEAYCPVKTPPHVAVLFNSNVRIE